MEGADRSKFYLSVICFYLVIIVCVQFYIVYYLKTEVDRFRPSEQSELSPEIIKEIECEVYNSEKCCPVYINNDKGIAVHEIWKRAIENGNGACPAGKLN